MHWIAIAVFSASFAVATLLMMAALRPRLRESQEDIVAPTPPRANPLDVRKVVRYSAIPWMNTLIQDLELAPRLRIFIDQSGMTWTLGRLILTCLACGLIPSYLLYLRSERIFVSMVVGAVGLVAPVGFLMFRRNQRLAQFQEQLPKSLDLIVSALRAGHSFNAALELAAREGAEPVRSEFRICFDEQHFGLDLRDAMDNLITRVPSKDLRIVAAIVLVQRETGGNLAEVLNSTAEIIRERYKLKRQVLVNTAHGRLTGWVIGLLPLVLLILLYTINPALESLLWKRELGLKLLAAGAAMMCLGSLAIRKITQLDV